MASLFLLSNGCAKITPSIDEPTQASFDGNNQNSGIVRIIETVSPDGDQEKEGYEITPGARDRYNAYIERYGERLIPPCKRDFGVSPMSNGNFTLTMEAAAKWDEMIILSKRDRINKSDTLLNKVGL